MLNKTQDTQTSKDIEAAVVEKSQENVLVVKMALKPNRTVIKIISMI